MADSGKQPSRIRVVLDLLRKLLGRNPTTPPGDPYAYAMAPLRHGPKGRNGAAVAEIEDDSDHTYLPRQH